MGQKKYRYIYIGMYNVYFIESYVYRMQCLLFEVVNLNLAWAYAEIFPGGQAQFKSPNFTFNEQKYILAAEKAKFFINLRKYWQKTTQM